MISPEGRGGNEVSPVHPRKAVSPILVSPSGNGGNEVSPVHPTKALSPILVSIEGREGNEVSPVHALKALDPIRVTPAGIGPTEVSPMQPLKASSPILVSSEGNEIDKRPIQFLKALVTIAVVPALITACGAQVSQLTHSSLLDGAPVGCPLGRADGWPDGWPVGSTDGMPVGTQDGNAVGTAVGRLLGAPDGCSVGALDGCVGMLLGIDDGCTDGWPDGCPVGEAMHNTLAVTPMPLSPVTTGTLDPDPLHSALLNEYVFNAKLDDPIKNSISTALMPVPPKATSPTKTTDSGKVGKEVKSEQA